MEEVLSLWAFAADVQSLLGGFILRPSRYASRAPPTLSDVFFVNDGQFSQSVIFLALIDHTRDHTRDHDHCREVHHLEVTDFLVVGDRQPGQRHAPFARLDPFDLISPDGP